MPVLIVHGESTLADLRHRLVGRSGPADLPDDVVDAIRRANRDVDLDDLRRGTVLTIPDHPDLRAAADDPADDPDDVLAQGLRAMVSALGDVVATSGEAAGQQARVEAEDRTTVRKALGLRAVQDAARDDPDLQAELERVKDRLALADEQADEAAADRERALATWRDDLDVVTQLGR